MRKNLVRVVVLVFAGSVSLGCASGGDSQCATEDEIPACSHETERALETFPLSLERLLAFQPPWHGQRYRGQVVAVEAERVTMELLGEPHHLHWPTDLPFAIAPGEDVVVEQKEGTSYLHFHQGALAYRVADPSKGSVHEEQRLRDLMIRTTGSCSSSLGVVAELDVGSSRLAPGESVELDGWRIHYLGGVSSPCSGTNDRGVWIADTKKERFHCEFPAYDWQPEEPCSEEVLQRATREHDFGDRSLVGGYPEGTYRITAVDAEGFQFTGGENGTVQELRWPGPLPIDVSEGDSVDVQKQGSWNVLSLPGGQVAFVLVHVLAEGGLKWLHDGSQLQVVPQCTMDNAPDLLGRGKTIWGARFQGGGGEFILRPGDEVQAGEWTYRVLSLVHFEWAYCTIGTISGYTDGFGLSGILVAHRRLEPGIE